MAERNTYRKDEQLDEPFNIRHLLLASSYIKKYIKKMGLAILFSGIAGVMVLFAPMLVQKALDEAIPQKNVRYLIVLVILTAVAYVLSIIFALLRSRIMVKVSQYIIYDIRKDLFAHLQKLKALYE